MRSEEKCKSLEMPNVVFSKLKSILQANGYIVCNIHFIPVYFVDPSS